MTDLTDEFPVTDLHEAMSQVRTAPRSFPFPNAWMVIRTITDSLTITFSEPDPVPSGGLHIPTDSGVYTGCDEWNILRDLALEREHSRNYNYERNLCGDGSVPSVFACQMQPMIMLKDGDVLDKDSITNEYYERGRKVDDFSVRVPAGVNHVKDLCICQHSRLQHSAVDFADTCSGRRLKNGDMIACRCERFEPVARTSKHAYRRGLKVMPTTVARLRPGDRVLAGWTTIHGKVRLTDTKAGALIAYVRNNPRPYRPDSSASGQGWQRRAVVVPTDLGESVPQTGGTRVLRVVGPL